MAQREKLIELLSKKIYPRVGADPAEVVADYLIDNGVTVQVHGRWYWDWAEDGHWECSACKKNPTAFMGFTHLNCDMNYCPNCGARMDLD